MGSAHGMDEAQRQYDNQTPPWYDEVGSECPFCKEWVENEDYDESNPCPDCEEDFERCPECEEWVWYSAACNCKEEDNEDSSRKESSKA